MSAPPATAGFRPPRSRIPSAGFGARLAARVSLCSSILTVLATLFFAASALAEPGRPALRPFYIIGHGADTLAEAGEYLEAGANGLEIDVNLPFPGTSVLCIGHGPALGHGAAGKKSVPLAEFLRGLHELARQHTNFCLVYFDCKRLAATPELGRQLLAAIRTQLAGTGPDELPLKAIISVGTLKDKAIFDDIAGQLGPREALMVDGVSDPVRVSHFFAAAGVRQQVFADGIVPFHTFFTHFSVYGAVRQACRLRDSRHDIRLVLTWSVNNPWLMTRYIHLGVDGIVVDRTFVWYNFCWENLGRGLRSLTRMVERDGPALGIRPARRDDPLLPTAAKTSAL